MKKDDVKIGGTYLAKVTNKVVPVRIESESRYGGWDATNLVTNKQVRIKSAQRLRGEVKHTKAFMEANLPPRQDQFAAAAAAQQDAGLAAPTPADPDRIPITKLMAKPKPAKAKKADPEPEPAPSAPLETSREETPKAGKTSGLDAAYQVLRTVGAPMQCKAIVKMMLDGGMWATDGKTPEATIHAAIAREIKAKGSASRFRKSERGKFEAVIEPRQAAEEFIPTGAFDGNTVISDADPGL